MKTEARLVILESVFFLLIASIIAFSLIGWRQFALFLTAVVAVAGRVALDYYYECISCCSPLSAKISLVPIIALVALSLTMISFQRHPFLMASLLILLFVFVIWKIAMHFNCAGRVAKRNG